MNSYNLVSFMTIFTDIDECADIAHVCSDLCNNTAGGFHCSCTPGNGLLADKKTCQSKQSTGISLGPCDLNADIHEVSVFEMLYNLLYCVELSRFFMIYCKNLQQY